MFEPTGARGRHLDRGMQDDLLGSLRHLVEVGPGALGKVLAAPMAVLAAGGGLVSEAFGLYYQMVEHLLAGELEDALKVGRLLASCPARTPSGEWRVFGRGLPEARLLDAVLDLRLGSEASSFCSISDEQACAFGRLLQQGRALLAEGVPALHDELTAIVSDVLLAQAPPESVYEFDGASHYQFWGLLLLNPKHHRDRLAVAEVLAHESGHSVLFGLCREQVLATNADDELYASPLRVDPRPMDGIIHATYVSARMALAMESLAKSGCLSPVEKATALQAAAEDRRRFHAGLSTVDQYARLTPLGRDVVESARAWIQRSS